MQYFGNLRYHKACFLSLCLHVILLLWIVSRDRPLPSTNKPFTDNKIIAYTYIEEREVPLQQKKTSPIKKILSLNKISKVYKIDKVNKKNDHTSNQAFGPRYENKNDPNAKKELLSLLHQAIAKKQSYPTEALMLNETGTAQIRFLLYPDGHIEQLSLLKSSGFSSLDSSALTAVKEITPITDAKTYLRQKTFFSVDVIFE